MFETGSYKFEIPKHHKSIIKVIGVGGGGSNAVNHMYRQGIKDVEFVVCNTDAQALNSSPVPYKLQIGTNLTEGLGCGANPEVGRAAAVESKDQIREMLAGTKMVFVTAGMGGGTGTGAAPVIAKIAKDMDILTVGIVTAPFAFEGKKKSGQAEHGIEALRVSCDTVLVILNDKLREIYGNLPIGQAFGEADNILTTAAKGIAEIITLTGYVNVDFQDVRTVMLNAGAAVMGSSETRGDNRATKAAQLALASPLLDNKDIMGAKKILLSIISGEDAELQMDELSQITEYIQEQAGDEAEVIFGHGVDPTIGDRIRVTVIATGFAHDGKVVKKDDEKKVHDLDRTQIPLFHAADNSVNQRDREIELMIKVETATKADKDKPVLSDPTPAFTEASAGKPTSTEPKTGKPGLAKAPVVEPTDDESKDETTADKTQEKEVKEDRPVLKREEKPVPAKPVQKRKAEEPPKVEPPKEGKSYTFTLFEKEEVAPSAENDSSADEGEESLFLSEEDEFGIGKEISADQIVNEEGLMELRKTKERLEQQAKARREKLKAYKKQEMTKEEFNEKWTLPAYLRRGVKMDNVPHSSEPFISRYNLNDDNNLLGNNKFLHDNVD